MSQPSEERGSAGALSRKVGPFPVWVWALVIGVAIVVFLRKRKGESSSSASSNAFNAPPNVASSPATIFPYPTDIFVTVSDPVKQPDTPGDGDPDTPDPNMPDRNTSVTYTVKSGDTLWDIENRFNLPHGTLYQANAANIEAAARQHGLGSSNSGHWIFPGMVLTVPK